MKAHSILTDDEVYRTEAFRLVLNTIKEKNNKLKLKIAMEEGLTSNKLPFYAHIDEINRYIDSQLN